MENSENDFQNLFNLAKEIKMLSGINQLLDWDMETYMPIGAVAIRGEQIETLTGIIHELKTGRKFTKALEKLIDIKTKAFKVQTLTDDQKNYIKQREAYPPAPQQLFIEFTKPIFNQVTSNVSSYFSNYRL